MQKHITLSQLTNVISGTLSERFKGSMWVVAEVSECKRNSSGHFYLSLVERQEGSNLPVAELKGAIWAQNYRRISEHFYSISGCDIQAGMKLLFCCTLSYHPNYGLSLIISDIDPTYTLGEGERMRQLTIAKLQSQGVWNLQREQNVMPTVIQRLAVISSATAAGFEDFCKQLDGSKYRFEVDLYEAMMQGEQTQSTIIKALERIMNSEKEYDSVIIIRGGGSASDLRWFDSYDLAFYVAQFPMPILTGIGHEKDTSVVDMVAFHSFKTPTAVASTLIERIAVLDNKLESLRSEVIALAQQKLLGESQRTLLAAQNLRACTMETLQQAALKLEGLRGAVPSLSRAIIERQQNRLEVAVKVIPQIASGIVERQLSRIGALRSYFLQSIQQILHSNEQRVSAAYHSLRNITNIRMQRSALELQQLSSRIPSSAEAILQRERYKIERVQSYLGQQSAFLVSNKQGQLDNLRSAFLRQATNLLQREQSRLNILQERVASNNPRRILAQGYSLVYDSKGKIVKHVEELSCGELMSFELLDGVARARVEELEPRRVK